MTRRVGFAVAAVVPLLMVAAIVLAPIALSDRFAAAAYCLWLAGVVMGCVWSDNVRLGHGTNRARMSGLAVAGGAVVLGVAAVWTSSRINAAGGCALTALMLVLGCVPFALLSAEPDR